MAFEGMAQQDAQYSFYMFNNVYFNPAYTGKKEALHVEVLHREQWRFFNIGDKIEGAPQSTSLSIHSPFKRSNNALGFNFHNDVIGPYKTFDFGINYAYRIPLGSKLKLSIGVKGTYKLYQVDNIDFLDKTDFVGQQINDFPNINTFNFGTGIYLWNKKDRFYVGFSVPRLLNNKLYHDLSAGTNSNANQEHQHYYATAGLVVGKQNGNFKFYPSTLIKFAKQTPIDFDVNTNFLFYDRLWLGAGYRFGGNYYVDNQEVKIGKGSAVIGMVKFMVVKNLEIGYAYDYTLSDLKSYQSGSHELLMNFKFDRKRDAIDGMRITTPRYINYF
ncbi:MAG: type IX secretion system PorP/SprF family membrane protein [Chitinophagales bacterium]|jgi:type IX secretion system PorP/SprF family membrane protein